MIKKIKEIDEIYLYLYWRIYQKADRDGKISLKEAEGYLSKMNHIPCKNVSKSFSKKLIFILQDKGMLDITPFRNTVRGDEILLKVPISHIEKRLAPYM